MKSGNVCLLSSVVITDEEGTEHSVYKAVPDQPETDKVRDLRSWWADDGPEPEAEDTYVIVSVRQVVQAERKLVLRTVGGKRRGRKPASTPDDGGDDLDD